MAGIKNTIRLEVAAKVRRSIRLEYIVRNVLMGFNLEKIFCILELPSAGNYNISFYHKSHCLAFFEFVKDKREHEYLKHFYYQTTFFYHGKNDYGAHV